MADKIKALKKEFKEYKTTVDKVLDNHKAAYANLKKAVEDHIWEPDAHHPAVLATQRAEARKKK